MARTSVRASLAPGLGFHAKSSKLFSYLYAIMKYTFLLLLFTLSLVRAKAQQVDSLYFNLYTDSLKKGTYNYINVEGKLSSGRIIPLDSSQVVFTCSTGQFMGNSLWLDPDTRTDKIEVVARLRDNPRKKITVLIYIKRLEYSGRVKTMDEVLGRKKSISG